MRYDWIAQVQLYNALYNATFLTEAIAEGLRDTRYPLLLIVIVVQNICVNVLRIFFLRMEMKCHTSWQNKETSTQNSPQSVRARDQQGTPVLCFSSHEAL